MKTDTKIQGPTTPKQSGWKRPVTVKKTTVKEKKESK